MIRTIGQRLKSAIDLGGTLAMIAIAAMFAWRLVSPPGPPTTITATKKSGPVPTDRVSLVGAFVKGIRRRR